MTDYTKATGSSGTMMIRDTGTTVELWIKAGSSTWINGATYGGTWSGSFDLPSGGAWLRIRSVSVTGDLTVTFTLNATGTAGLGGPTTLTASIDRSLAPSAPSTPTITSLTSTSFIASFVDGANNGAAIDLRQIGYGTGSSNPTTIITSDGSTSITGRAPGTTYYVWARTHNAKGYSAWSGRRTVTTYRVPDAPDPVEETLITQTTMHTRFTGNGNGGTAVTQWELGYGTDPNTPLISVASTGTIDISGLLPGTIYYFWARGLNSVGWSPYSARTTAKTIAGARILVANFMGPGSTWTDAVPYVNVAGVWKLARPWAKIAGLWKVSG